MAVRRLAAAIAAAVLVAPAAAAAPPVERIGSGADEVWILLPHGTPTSIVVFGHGWSVPTPDSTFAPWLDHLRTRGAIVVYPRYEAAGHGSLADFQAGVEEGFARLRALRLPVVAVGKSWGGAAVFAYAAMARSWHVPAPRAVLSIFPALPLGGLPRQQLPARTRVEILVGDADTIAGSAGANAFWSWLAGHARKRYVVVRSRPGFVADHDSAQRSDAVARAIFWRPLDRLLVQARR